MLIQCIAMHFYTTWTVRKVPWYIYLFPRCKCKWDSCYEQINAHSSHHPSSPICLELLKSWQLSILFTVKFDKVTSYENDGYIVYWRKVLIYTTCLTDNQKTTCYFSSFPLFTYIDIHILSSGQTFIPQASLHFNSGDSHVTQDIHRGYRAQWC